MTDKEKQEIIEMGGCLSMRKSDYAEAENTELKWVSKYEALRIDHELITKILQDRLDVAEAKLSKAREALEAISYNDKFGCVNHEEHFKIADKTLKEISED